MTITTNFEPEGATFPASALLPKAETAVVSFLQKYPEYNGLDVVIAIFDSGVDPQASGLHTLCDGKTVKVIERFDCTGCGDVEVSKRVNANEKGFITGLSGRQLKLTPEMIAKNTANGEYRIGLKSFFDLYPSKVRNVSTGLNKTRHWDGPHKAAVAELSRKINEFDAQNPDSTKLSWDKKLLKENLDSNLEMLNNYEKMYNDIKITFDCILYQTDEGWQAVIDNTEKGDLANAVHIGEYTRTHEMQKIDDLLSVSINVHDEGNVLEIVGMCSTHGTHVASIASGNHASQDIDGVAPNAKIVSITIGDGRLGSMETGAALVRGMMKVMELCRAGTKVDVINMSYGEHAHWSNAGRLGEIMSEVVNKYGVVWVASAGNHGPALCTIGTPPDTVDLCCIGAGAYFSSQMLEGNYAVCDKVPGNVYTWTSRDPCIDGGQGVTVCAPGGAIASVPQFTMSKQQLMHGTSMAAPHIAGAIGLLISGLKQEGIEYSPYSIRRAISVTANKLSYVDPFAQGNGLLNVEKAFEHLLQHKNAQENMLRFIVQCGINNGKGIHIREGFLKKPANYNVNVEPVFLNAKEVDPMKKINFNVRLALVSSQPWVQCGSFLDLSYAMRSFAVKIDPSSLPHGVHTAVIRAYDTACVQKGSLFEVPVTVVQPHVLNCEESREFKPKSNTNDGNMEFQPGHIQRDFILVPPGATWAVFKARSTEKNRDNKVMDKIYLHTMQILTGRSCRALETSKIINVVTEDEAIVKFKCMENNILELCVAKYWMTNGVSHINYSLEFHGIRNLLSNQMLAGRGIHKLEVSALVCEELQPVIGLKTAAVVLKPIEAKLSPLSATRDVIPESRQIYQNLMTYSLNLPKTSEIALYAPLFSSMLYESEFESQMWMLFDCNKVMVAVGDAHSKSNYTKLEKGEYTAKLQVRHEKREVLEKISEATLVALFKLPNAITLDIYDHYNQATTAGRKFTSSMLKAERNRVLYVAPLSQEKLTKAALPANCSYISGALSLPKDDAAKRVDLTEFLYILSPSEANKKNGNGNAANAASTNAANNTNGTAISLVKDGAKPGSAILTPTASTSGDVGAVVVSPAAATTTVSPKKNKLNPDEYPELLRDFQCSMMLKYDLDKAEKIYKEIISEHPKHLLAHLLLSQSIESAELKIQYPFTFVSSNKLNADESVEDKQKDEVQKTRIALERIVELSDLVLKETDKNALLAYYGVKYDVRPDAIKIKTAMEKQKNCFVEALVRKGVAIGKLSALENKVKDRRLELDNIYAEIVQFSDVNDAKIAQFTLWHAFAHQHYGRMYKLLNKQFEDKRNREVYDELWLVAVALNYEHIKTAIKRLTVTHFPQSYRLF